MEITSRSTVRKRDGCEYNQNNTEFPILSLRKDILVKNHSWPRFPNTDQRSIELYEYMLLTTDTLWDPSSDPTRDSIIPTFVSVVL